MHSTLRPDLLRPEFWLPALVLLACAGCWEEIHYVPSEEPDTRDVAAVRDERPATPPANEPPVAATVEETDEWPLEEESANELDADELFGELEGEGDLTEDAPAERSQPLPDVEPSMPRESTRPAAEQQQNTRRMAWLLGSKLSLAVLKNDRAGPTDEIAKLFEQSQMLAEMLGTTIGDLPPPPAADKPRQPFDRALDYLVSEGRTIGLSLAEQQGDDHAALFELAMKTNVLLALYRPDAPIVGTLAGAIRQSSKRANLPAELWRPLLGKLDRGAPAAEVHDAVFAMYAEVDRFLKTTP
jgi:hypothetical protein